MQTALAINGNFYITISIFFGACNRIRHLGTSTKKQRVHRSAQVLESVQDFLIKLDMKPCACMHLLSGNKHFFIKSCHRQTYEYYEQPS